MTYVSAAAHGTGRNGNKITGGVLRNDVAISHHGRTASKMTVSQTNEAFAAAKRKQQGKK